MIRRVLHHKKVIFGVVRMCFCDKHAPPVWPEPKLMNVQNDEELQGQWRAMEVRVNTRKSKRDGKVGRTGLKRTDEDYWAEGGVYDAAAEKADS